MSKVYLDGFTGWKNVSDEFGAGSWGERTIRMDEPDHVFAVYEQGNYEGSALVLFAKDGKMFSVEGSHCSCYGLEGQWEPHSESKETILKQATESSWGLWEANKDAILRFLAEVTPD